MVFGELPWANWPTRLPQLFERVGRNSDRVGAKRRPMTGSAYCRHLDVIK
jgi:hypothetical protein